MTPKLTAENLRALIKHMDNLPEDDSAWDDLFYSWLHAHDDGTWHPGVCCHAPLPCPQRKTWLEMSRELEAEG